METNPEQWTNLFCLLSGFLVGGIASAAVQIFALRFSPGSEKYYVLAVPKKVDQNVRT